LVGKLPTVVKKIKCKSALADGTSDKATLKFRGFAATKNANPVSHNSNLFPVFQNCPYLAQMRGDYHRNITRETID